MTKKFKIVSISSEVSPYSKSGGLADVARSLPKSLKRLGHSVIIITPLYKITVDIRKHKLKKIFHDIPLQFYKNRELTVSYYKGVLMKGLPIYFVSCDKYFGKKKRIYGSDDENKRFYVFNMAALRLLQLIKFQPDIIHCHDWHTGLIPELVKKKFKGSETLKNAATVFTIHNLTFQLGHNWWGIDGKKRDRGTTPLPDLKNQRHLERINFAKRAILQADIINAVSETYAQEIVKRSFGQDLNRILQNRQHKLFGVVNGIDYNEFNPAVDPGLKMNYDYRKILRKNINKDTLQRRYKLKRDRRYFIIVMTSRIAEQKGFDILLPIIPELMRQSIELIFMGDGDKEYIDKIKKVIKKYPNRIVMTPWEKNKNKETMLYAGGDASLFPSRFEPCGIGQLKSMRYGCVPIARGIGGLSDTIEDYVVDSKTGNGFIFKNYDSASVLVAIIRASSHFHHRRAWRDLVARGMKQSNSWELPAKKYLELYDKALKLKKG
jgi:starch synthase